MNNKKMEKEFDFLIIGAGSAGSVLANRLSENPAHDVALFEAGKQDNTWKIDMPAALTYNLMNTKYNWGYYTESEPALNQRKLYWPRGKVLGGSSSLNAMVYIRGHAEDFNRWEKEGAVGWNYESILPYFKKSETFSKGGNDYRGDSGPLKVIDKMSDNPLFDAFILAGMQAGFPFSPDINGKQQEGFGRFDMTIHDGVRQSAAAAYLHPIIGRRQNLKIFLHSPVIKILIENKKAIGIEFKQGNKIKKCYARREVILCGGAINSPQLLMLSGIGPSDHLKKHGIETIVNLPGVGQNLQDHLEFYMQFECKKKITLYSMANPIKKIKTGIEWFLTQQGLGASSHLEAGAFICSRPDVAHPDLQYHFLPGLINNHGRSFGNSHSFQVHVGTMRPESRGYLELSSANPQQHPKIHANYLKIDNDLNDLLAAIPITREIFNQLAFDKYKGKEIQPGVSCFSKSEMTAFIRDKVESAYHPCGTCKMGTDPMSVVDPEAKVHGIDHLRVVDASIMPSMISGNLNAPTIMMGEKVSDLILKSHRIQETTDELATTFPSPALVR